MELGPGEISKDSTHSLETGNLSPPAPKEIYDTSRPRGHFSLFQKMLVG